MNPGFWMRIIWFGTLIFTILYIGGSPLFHLAQLCLASISCHLTTLVRLYWSLSTKYSYPLGTVQLAIGVEVPLTQFTLSTLLVEPRVALMNLSWGWFFAFI